MAAIDNYIETLQRTLTQFMRDYIQLLPESDTILHRTFTFNDAIQIQQSIDYNESIKDMEHKIHNVSRLQIRIPIVAPMKAGKSTIINAIIGSDYLPIRTDAMTALPTTVVLKLGGPQIEGVHPVQFVLEDKTQNALETLRASVIEQLKKDFDNDKELDTLLLENPHLIKTAKALRDSGTGPMFKLLSKLDGEEQIRNTLTFINELVRISIYLSSCQSSPVLSLTSFLNNYPAINVNYRPIQSVEYELERRCQVLLIDTPGPNEAAAVVQLSEILKNELKNADIILVVVEYGHINTEVDAKIAGDIKKIRALKSDQKCVYVLVNKVDLRQEEDMSEEELCQHIASAYEVTLDCVFALSARRALIAKKFLADYQKSIQNNDKLDITTSSTATNILSTYFPINWRSYSKKSQPADVAEKAKELYRNSGISDFLKRAIETVLGQVVRRCVQSGVDACAKVSKDLITGVDIRLNGLELLEDRLRQEIDGLIQDLQDLTDILENQPAAIQQISGILEKKLNSVFQEALSQSAESVKQIFDPNNTEWYDSVEKDRQLKAKDTELKIATGSLIISGAVTGRIASEITTLSERQDDLMRFKKNGGVIFENSLAAVHSTGGLHTAIMGAFVGAIVGSTIVKNIMSIMHGNEEVRFDNKEGARKFIDGITKMVNELSKAVYSTIEQDVSNACHGALEQYYKELSGKTITILERAKDRLNSTFDTQLSTPEKAELKPEEIHLNVEDIGRTQRFRFASLPWFTDGKHTINDDKHFVSRGKLQEECVQSVKANLDRVQTYIIEKTINEMNANFISHFKKLQAYLRKYRGYAELCLLDKNLTKENQEIFKFQLQKLKKQLKDKEEETKRFTASIDWNRLV